jgi:hypothetical protein
LKNSNNIDITQECIDNLVDTVCDIFVQRAKEVFDVNMIKTIKPWFTKYMYCKNARQNFRKAKQLFKRYGSNIFKEDLYRKEKY